MSATQSSLPRLGKRHRHRHSCWQMQRPSFRTLREGQRICSRHGNWPKHLPQFGKESESQGWSRIGHGQRFHILDWFFQREKRVNWRHHIALTCLPPPFGMPSGCLRDGFWIASEHFQTDFKIVFPYATRLRNPSSRPFCSQPPFICQQTAIIAIIL